LTKIIEENIYFNHIKKVRSKNTFHNIFFLLHMLC